MLGARWLAFSASVGAAFIAASACGSRTGLLVPPPSYDASADGTPEEDALPPLDVNEEPINTCPDAGSTLIYLIANTVSSSASVLMSFYPPTASFTTIGTIDCPEPQGTTFSMAVDRTSGLAYVEYSSGNLYLVTTTSPPICTPTPFVPQQGGFPPQFGMGFSANAVDASTPETLYVAGDPGGLGADAGADGILATIDTRTFQLTPIGPFSPLVSGAELTGTSSGELFAFYATTPTAPDSFIGQIDRATAQVTGQAVLAGVSQGTGWAFAFWGGDFYTFTAPGGPGTSSVVTRYRPSDGSVAQVAQAAGLTIVGAGVSTCAPSQ